MTPAEIKQARQTLGLTRPQLAELLETTAQNVGRMEMDPATNTTARQPAVRMVALIKAYLAGYRPEDWPHKGEGE